MNNMNDNLLENVLENEIYCQRNNYFYFVLIFFIFIIFPLFALVILYEPNIF